MMVASIAIFLIGALVILAGICTAINTSLGGTRSDYDDGSGLLMVGGTACMLVAVFSAILDWVS